MAKPTVNPADNYVSPRLRRAGAAPGASVRVLAVEVTQAIQNLAHDVRLIAGKRTVIRVYLAPEGLTRNTKVQGELMIAAASGAPARYVTSDNVVTLSAAGHPSLDGQRRDATLSLNFIVEQPVGQLHVEVKRVAAEAGGAEIQVAQGAPTRTVVFVQGGPLRVRAVGLRYVDSRVTPPVRHAPEAVHFDLMRSFLTRVYPVPRVEWSQIVVTADANFVPPFSGPLLPNRRDPLWEALLQIAHNFMSRLRQADINGGVDRRTHYYGLVSDASGFFRGAANTIPTTPNPAAVAVGPAGRPSGSLSWDKDDSYADWYAAHELAHTYGRFHPGFCGGQDASDTTFPYPNGEISNAVGDHVAFDVGDPALGLPMTAYGRDHAHDIMTYCNVQWISKHTYDALYDRLLLENALAPTIG
jgi:hypothetical protein